MSCSEITQASAKRSVYCLNLFETSDPQKWENAYKEIMNPKYQKNTRNFSRQIHGKKNEGRPPLIYLIPRVRGGSSYKETPLNGENPNNLQYCPISKGYSMQDVS